MFDATVIQSLPVHALRFERPSTMVAGHCRGNPPLRGARVEDAGNEDVICLGSAWAEFRAEERVRENNRGGGLEDHTSILVVAADGPYPAAQRFSVG